MTNSTATPMTPAELAIELDTDARTTRKFLRSITPIESHPGKGSKWAIDRKSIKSMKSQFAKFIAARDAKSTPDAD